MFESLSEKLDSAFKKLRGHGRLTEGNIDEGLKEVRMALLEADVHYRVVKGFIEEVRSRSLGQEVMGSLTPGQQVVKIVYEKLTELMGSRHEGLNLGGAPPAAIMLVGLQGSGKTTTAGKLAHPAAQIGRRPFLVPADVYRPAAIDQLKKLAEQSTCRSSRRPRIRTRCDLRGGQTGAFQKGATTLIIDTAGRLHIDEELMAELARIKETIRPAEILLVADAMTGQDAVNIAKSFNDRLDISGVVLTKMDGDARGGAALSIRAVTGKPIKFVGVGEKLERARAVPPRSHGLAHPRHGRCPQPDRKGAGDGRPEKGARAPEEAAQEPVHARGLPRPVGQQVRKMGSLSDILKMIPGMGKVKEIKNLEIDDGEFVRIEAIINSMTPQERRQHGIINGSRRRRIATGSGTRVQDVNGLLKNYTQMLKMLKKFNQGGIRRGMLPF